DASGVVLRRRYRALATSRERYTSHSTRVPSEDGNLPATLRIPYARRVIEGRRCNPMAISVESRARESHLTPEEMDLLALRQIPYPFRAVRGCRQHPIFFGVEHGAHDRVGMTLEDSNLFAAVSIPDTGSVVVRPCKNLHSISAEGRAAD